MPINFERLDEAILLVTADGKIPEVEINAIFMDGVFPFCEAMMPNPVHLIYDISALDMEYEEFIEYLESVSKSRLLGNMPENIKQHFLGTNKWIDRLDCWINEHYGTDMRVFTDCDTALKFARAHSQYS